MIDPIERFLNYLTVEKGLSPNTLEAYKRDILQFRNHLEQNGKEITAFKKDDLVSFIDNLRNMGRQASTLARHIAALRGFCKFLLIHQLGG